MKIIDLTHCIEESMPVYPGTEGPTLVQANTIEKDGFRETLMTMYSHTGTHMDAPSHIFSEGITLDELSVSAFAGKGLVIDCRNLGEGGVIDMTFIEPLKALADEADFLLFMTGWDEFWGTETYYGNYPCIDRAVAKFVVESGKKGIGLDTISVDPITDYGLRHHRRILGTNRMVIIENLTALVELGKGLFDFTVLPMKYKNSDGAPVRAIGCVE